MQDRPPAYVLLRWIFFVIFFVVMIILLIGAMIITTMIYTASSGGDVGRTLDQYLPLIAASFGPNSIVQRYFSDVIPTFWSFIAPLAQLAIILLILEWFLSRMGINFSKVEQVAGRGVYIISLMAITFISIMSIINKELLDKIWDSTSPVLVAGLIVAAVGYGLSHFKIDQVPGRGIYITILMAITFIAIISVVNKEFLDKIWDSTSPVLVAGFIVAAVGYGLSRLGFSSELVRRITDINIQGVIATVVISSLAILSIVNIPGANIVKDLALVIVGFYFGSRRSDQGQTSGKLDDT
jgi:hypothetical protein